MSFIAFEPAARLHELGSYGGRLHYEVFTEEQVLGEMRNVISPNKSGSSGT